MYASVWFINLLISFLTVRHKSQRMRSFPSSWKETARGRSMYIDLLDIVFLLGPSSRVLISITTMHDPTLILTWPAPAPKRVAASVGDTTLSLKNLSLRALWANTILLQFTTDVQPAHRDVQLYHLVKVFENTCTASGL